MKKYLKKIKRYISNKINLAIVNYNVPLRYKPKIIVEVNKRKLNDVESIETGDEALFKILWGFGYKSYLIGAKINKIDNLSALTNRSDYDILCIYEH